MIDLALTEHEVREYVTGGITEASKENTQEIVKYKNGERRAQRIIVESIENPLIPFVSNLKISQATYDKLVNLYYVSTSGKSMFLWKKIYRMKK